MQSPLKYFSLCTLRTAQVARLRDMFGKSMEEEESIQSLIQTAEAKLGLDLSGATLSAKLDTVLFDAQVCAAPDFNSSPLLTSRSRACTVCRSLNMVRRVPSRRHRIYSLCWYFMSGFLVRL